jgi:hypothetical protein
MLNVLPTLIRQAAIWKYLADGTNQGKAWREPDFSDATWSEGPAELVVPHQRADRFDLTLRATSGTAPAVRTPSR